MRPLLVALALGACSDGDRRSGDDAGAPAADAEVTLDAASLDAAEPDAAVDAAAVADCPVAAELGDLGLLLGFASKPEDDVFFQASLEPGAAVLDTLLLELLDGQTVFAEGIAPGEYALEGAELDYATCGLCVRLMADAPAGATSSDFYMAAGGTVTLTSVEAQLTGSLRDVRLVRVRIDPATFWTAPLGDGCEATIRSVTFDQPLL